MTGVVLLGVVDVDVGWTLHQRAVSAPRYVLTMSDMATLGAFLALLIAMEIFVNIILYLREDVILT